MRTSTIAGNWKMYKTPTDTRFFFEELRGLIGCSPQREVVICPPYLDIEMAVVATRGSRIQIGAQNLYWEKEGAFTGEISGSMIKGAGCSHGIVGHSERRRYFGETNESVLKKTRSALEAGLTPIICVGEREKQNMKNVLIEQFQQGIGSLSKTIRRNRNSVRTGLGNRHRQRRHAGNQQ